MALNNVITSQVAASTPPVTPASNPNNPLNRPTVEVNNPAPKTNAQIVAEDFAYRKPVPVVTADKASADLFAKQSFLTNTQQSMQQQSDNVQRSKSELDQMAREKAIQDATNGLKQQEIDAKNKLGNDISKLSGTDATDVQSALVKLNEQSDKEFAKYQSDIQSLQNGTFPLSASDQASIKAIEQKFNKIKEAQQLYNQNYEAGITQLGITSGRARYAGEMEMGNIKNAVDQGLSKVTDIELAATSAVEELKAAIEEKNYKRINQAYTEINKNLERKSDAIKDLNKTINEEAERIQKKALDEQQKTMNDLNIRKANQELLEGDIDLYSSSVLGYDEVGNLTLMDDANINALAAELGVPPALLKSSAQKKYSELVKLDQESAQRELNILKAQAENKLIGLSNDEIELQNAIKRGEVPASTTLLEWQQMNAEATRAPVVVDTSGLTPRQNQNFLSISNKYQSNEVIKAGEKGYTAIQIADEVLKNPGNAASQISLLYTLVKNLDPDSAVREGEIALAQSTQSYLSKFKTTFERLDEGKVISEKSAKELAEETKKLAQKWSDTAKNKEQQFRSQANVAGVGEAFDEYLGGFNQLYKKEPSKKEYISISDFADNASEVERGSFNALRKAFPKTNSDELFKFWQEEQGKTNDQGTSVNYPKTDVSKIKNGAKVSTAIGSGTATGIQAGSSLWAEGLDLVLEGGGSWGYGAPVKAPFSGTIIAAKPNGGFGNQVKIKLDNGEELWISHLANMNVKPGQKITQGTLIGAQGNTGSVLGSNGRKLTPAEIKEGRGTHLDLTMKNKNGKLYSSQEVASFLGTKLV